MGRYPEVEQHISEAQLIPMERDALRAMTSFDHAHFDESVRLTEERVAHYKSTGHSRVVLEMYGTLLFRRAFACAPMSVTDIDSFLETASRSMHDAAFRSALMAKAILVAGNLEDYADVWAEQSANLQMLGSELGYREWFPRVLHHIRIDDTSRLQDLYTRWAHANLSWTPGNATVEWLFAAVGYARQLDWTGVEFLEPEGSVTRRWQKRLRQLIALSPSG
jgi:hypothetical protein